MPTESIAGEVERELKKHVLACGSIAWEMEMEVKKQMVLYRGLKHRYESKICPCLT